MDKLSKAQKAFIQKWGKDRSYEPFYLFDLRGGEFPTSDILANRFGFIVLEKPQIYPKTWVYTWTEAGKKAWATI